MPANRSTHDAPAPAARLRLGRGLLVGLATALLALAILGLSATAYAGEWVQASCINPNQTAAGSQGWSSFASGGGYGSTNSTSCGPGAPAFALLSSDAPVAVGAHETLQYTPPPGSTLAGGQLDVGMSADGHGYDASGTAVAYTPEYAYDGSNVFFQCAAGLQPCAGFTNDFTGELEIPSGRGGNLYLEAGCGGESSPTLRSCDEGASDGAWSLIQLWWADLRLSNDATPAASAISGTLLDGEARGSRELTLTATDPDGPGVYSINVQADGQTLYTATPDTNNGQCTPVGISGTALMFDSSQPCRQSESVDLPIETTLVRDGPHTLKVTVEDAAQNTSVVYDNTITTHNAPTNTTAPAVAASGQVQPGSTLTAEPGQWSAPSGTGTTSYSYQWQDCDEEGASCQTIPGAEDSSYSATPNDVGHALRVLLTASDSDGSASAASPASAVVNPPALTPTNDHHEQRRRHEPDGRLDPGSTQRERSKRERAAAPRRASDHHPQLREARAHDHRPARQRDRRTDRERHARHTRTGRRRRLPAAHRLTPARQRTALSPCTCHADRRGCPDRLPGLLERRPLQHPGRRPGERQRRCADAHHSTAQRTKRANRPQRTGSRPGTAGRRRRRDPRPLPRRLGAVADTANERRRALPGRVPVPGGRRTLPIPRRGFRRPSRLPLHPRGKHDGRCHDPLTCAPIDHTRAAVAPSQSCSRRSLRWQSGRAKPRPTR